MHRSVKKRIVLFIAVLISIIGIILSHTYREYIYLNKLYDFHLADTIGSWLCVPASSLFFYGISDKYNFKQYIIISVTAYLLFELISLTGLHGTFDIFDVIAILLSGLIFFAIYAGMKKIT